MRSIRRGMTGSGLRMVILGGAVGFLSVAVGVTGCALFQSEQVKKGKHLYEHYCMHCHGEHGRQNEGYNWAQMPDPRPKDLSNKGEMSTFKDEEIFNTISRDMKDTTPNVGDKIGDDEFAVPTMPTFKYTLSEDEIWAIVGYVRTLHGTKLAFNVEDRKKELDDKLKEVQGVFDQAKQALAAADKTAEDEADKAGKDVDDNATAKERDAMDKATKELEIAQAAATNFIKRPEFAPIPRPDLAMSAERVFAGTYITEAEVRDRAIAWVPEVMRFADPAQPSSTVEDELDGEAVTQISSANDDSPAPREMAA